MKKILVISIVMLFTTASLYADYKGEIVEQGNHEQLLALNGLYKKLHDIQNSHVMI